MNDRYKVILGCVLVLGVMALGCAIALGQVEEKTSFGLSPILIMLGKVVLDFSEWMFRGRHESPIEPPKPARKITIEDEPTSRPDDQSAD